MHQGLDKYCRDLKLNVEQGRCGKQSAPSCELKPIAPRAIKKQGA